jgi:hypothetical protein
MADAQQGFHAHNDAINEADETLAVGDVARAIDECVLSANEVGRERRAEITSVNDDSLQRFSRQPGRLTHEYAHVMPGAECMPQHVGAERSRCAEDDQPHLLVLISVWFSRLSIARLGSRAHSSRHGSAKAIT